MDRPVTGDPPERILYTPTALSVYFSPQAPAHGREVRATQPSSSLIPTMRRSLTAQPIDPFLLLSPETLEIEVVRIQLIRLGSVAERNSPQDQLVRHPVYQMIGIQAAPNTVIGVGTHVSCQWWEGRIRSVRSVQHEYIRYTCDQGDLPFTLVDVPLQEAEVPWFRLLRQATRCIISCMLGCHVYP